MVDGTTLLLEDPGIRDSPSSGSTELQTVCARWRRTNEGVVVEVQTPGSITTRSAYKEWLASMNN